MTDPFAHIRAQLGPVDEDGGSFTDETDGANLCEGCVRDLLDDADALLPVMRAAQEVRDTNTIPFVGKSEDNSEMIIRHSKAELKLRYALAALPEHLK